VDQCRLLVGAKISGQVSRLMLRLFAASLEMNERPIACFVMRAKCRLASGGLRRRAAGRASAGLFPCDFLEQLQDFIQIQIASENPHET
jgi:hypothetical protein